MSSTLSITTFKLKSASIPGMGTRTHHVNPEVMWSRSAANPSTMPLLLIILHFNWNTHFIIITVIHMPLYFISNVNKSGWSGVVVKACKNISKLFQCITRFSESWLKWVRFPYSDPVFVVSTSNGPQYFKDTLYWEIIRSAANPSTMPLLLIILHFNFFNPYIW